jgi:hypothetical protein
MAIRFGPCFIAWMCVGWAAKLMADEPAVTDDALRGAIEKSLPLLMKGAVGHRENRTCFGCHNQGLPILALSAARAKGFAIDEEELGRQTAFIAKFLDGNREKYLEGKGQGGQADTAGYALWTLAAAGYSPDETTAAVAEYLLQRHKDRVHWASSSNRPPSEASSITTTYLGLYGLKNFSTTEQQPRSEERTAAVLKWLLATPAKDTEERVFRLLALGLIDAPSADVEAATKELLAKQREDGGWAQLDRAEGSATEPEWAARSDAYATGSALVALYEAGGSKPTSSAYQNGLTYLLKTQQADGSWHVPSRSKPFQVYFESGFPHGKDQFISCAASAWATWAMVAAVEK